MLLNWQPEAMIKTLYCNKIERHERFSMMNKHLSTLLLSLSLTGLVGCQSIKTAPNIASNSQVPAAEQFKITGKIGVRTPKQNGSAFYGWTQVGEQFAIDLTGALGIGQTSIRGKSGDVTLTSSKTGTLKAQTPEELLFKATGWQAPITHLISWVNGQAVTASAKTEKDAQGRNIAIQEGGWSATLNYENEAAKYPNKLNLIDDAKQNRVTLTIQSRE